MKPNRDMKLTKEEKRSSLEAPFWNDKQEIDKNSKLNKEIAEICKDIKFNKE